MARPLPASEFQVAEARSGGPRWPDFIILGAMKAGTTSLFDWLGACPEVELPAVKEPATLCAHDLGPDDWSRYLSLFATTAVTGEASVRYGWPSEAARVATRVSAAPRRPALIFVAREPVDRLRSDYRHNVLKGRETRPFARAVADPASAAVQRSQYSATLSTYRGVLGETPLLLRFEDLVGDDGSAWRSVLSHLGLDTRPRPSSNANPTIGRRSTTALGSRSIDGGGAIASLIRTASRRAPTSMRSAARRLHDRRRGDTIAELLESGAAPLPTATADALDAERQRLRADWELAW
ncbi:MAG: hypothetical protein AAGD18_20575 [Actinomycetota bacterium]